MENRCIPVLDKKRGIYWLDIDDICFCSIEDRRITYHTKHEVFYQIANFDELLQFLTPEDGFEKVDRGIVIKVDNVTYFHSKYGLVYFDNPVGKQSKFATVAATYMDKVTKLLGAGKVTGKKRT